MSESRIERDRVTISREAMAGKAPAVAPSWVPPVLKRFYDFTRKWAGSFSGELKENREEELIKAVSKNFKEQI